LDGTGLKWDWAKVGLKCDTGFRDTIKGLSNINGETVQCKGFSATQYLGYPKVQRTNK